jgi:hypothetical protein
MTVAIESLLFPVSDVEIVAASTVPTVNKPAWITECVNKGHGPNGDCDAWVAT